MSKPRVIAFYLPQFHPIPENDEWWGKGFTEWTNVGKAKPLFPGHNQPKVPTELGYYDLRLPEVRAAQAELAREAGVEGFCYWHYYFGNGKMLMEKPLQDVISSGEPDFPFCLGWANHSWYAKLWDKDTTKDRLLIEQVYGGVEDYTQHFYTMLNTFRDSRYMTVDGKLIFLIFSPDTFDDASTFIKCWRRLAEKEGLAGFHFIAHNFNHNLDFTQYYAQGYDAIYTNRCMEGASVFQRNPFVTLKNGISRIIGFPRIVNFRRIIEANGCVFDSEENVYPGIICNWDHTPRSKNRGICFKNFTLPLFALHISKVFESVRNKKPEHQIVFLKSWNEWGEGNFMEPDMEFGRGKIETLRKVIDNFTPPHIILNANCQYNLPVLITNTLGRVA